MMEGDAQERLPMVMTASLNGFPMVMCISDASLFINDMLDKDDNQAFAMAVVEHLIGSRDNVNIIFDESRHIQDSTPKNILYNFENAYVYLIHIFFVTETGSDTINMVLQVGKVVIIGIFFYVFSLVYVGTKNPRRYRSRYDPTYHVEYEFGGYNRTIRLYSLINSAIQERFKLIFVDAEHVYDSETKQVHSLKDRKFLRGLLRDPVLEKFYMKPEKDYSLKAISEIHQQLMILRAHEEVYE